jgi:MarR family transcriptional regulator for hemolysin
VLNYNFDESLGYWLTVTADTMREAINDELGRHGITYRQFQVLAWLAHDGEETSQASLAARMAIEPPTLVGLLDRMEQQGWIARVASADDRRKKIVRPAPAAGEVWETMVNALLKVRARATSRLKPQQAALLNEMLRTVHETLVETERPSAARAI